MDREVSCPQCEKPDDLVRLAVDLGDDVGYEATYFCVKCGVVFGFQPLSELGPVVRIEVDGAETRA